MRLILLIILFPSLCFGADVMFSKNLSDISDITGFELFVSDDPEGPYVPMEGRVVFDGKTGKVAFSKGVEKKLRYYFIRVYREGDESYNAGPVKSLKINPKYDGIKSFDASASLSGSLDFEIDVTDGAKTVDK